MRQRWENAAFGVLVAAILAMGVLVLLVLSGHLVADTGEPAATRNNTGEPTTKRQRSKAEPVPATRTVRATPVTSVTVTATRGDCWISAHRGSATGPVLAERLLAEGEAVTLRGSRIWLQLGAAGNVDVRVNGRARPIPSGTANLVLG
jgi:hypothetical protein